MNLIFLVLFKWPYALSTGFDTSHKNNYALQGNTYVNTRLMHITFLWQKCTSKILYDAFLLGDDCKKKWFTLRDSFRRTLKKRKSKTGEKRKKWKPWKFEKEMAFLLPCFEERSQVSNLGDISERDSDDIGDDDGNSGDNESVAEDESRPSSATSRHSCVQSQPNESISSGVSSVITNKPGHRFKKAQKTPPVRAAQVLQTYLENKTPKQPEDQLTKFFQAMELTVRSLPYPLQLQTKSKIFQIVNEAEMRAVSYGQNPAPPQSTPHLTSFSEFSTPQAIPHSSFIAGTGYPVNSPSTSYQYRHPPQNNQNQGHFEPIYYSSEEHSPIIYHENQTTSNVPQPQHTPNSSTNTPTSNGSFPNNIA